MNMKYPIQVLRTHLNLDQRKSCKKLIRGILSSLFVIIPLDFDQLRTRNFKNGVKSSHQLIFWLVNLRIFNSRFRSRNGRTQP